MKQETIVWQWHQQDHMRNHLHLLLTENHASTSLLKVNVETGC